MSHSEAAKPRDLVADVNYFAADGTTRKPGEFKKPTHGVQADHYRSMTIQDVRPVVDNFKLDINGFQFAKIPVKERGVTDGEMIKHDYYQECAELVKSM